MSTETTETTLSPDVSGAVDLGAAVRELGDRIALVKAVIAGADRDRVAESNALPWTDTEQREQVFAGMGAIAPPYDPETLAILHENSSALRPNIDAYVTNIEAFGHRLEPVIDLDAGDADVRIANAMIVERRRQQKVDGADEQEASGAPTPEDVAAKKAQITEAMRLERARLETFFEFACVDISFVTLRRRTRQDLEVTGNAYWEVLRDGAGQLCQLVYLPAFTMRLLPLELALVEVEMPIKISELSLDTMAIRRRFRRFVQVFEQQIVFFKEFGDPRILSRKTGRYYPSVDELLAADPADGPATEVLHFAIHNARSAYGVPRWIGNLLSVLGTRQAEEVNFLYFENKSVPPLAILVSGGRLAAQSIPRIESYIQNHIKGKRNFHSILIIEAEPPSGGLDHTGHMKIELRPLTNAQHNDALFLGYDERNCDKIGQSFRLPRLLRGDSLDNNRSTAESSLSFAEMQVFQPEREEFDFAINRKLLADMGICLWRFKSNSPVTRDPATMAEIIRNLANANVLTPEEGRLLAGDVFNREFKKINAAWVTQPVPLTLAGLAPTPEPASTLGPDPDVQKRAPAGAATGTTAPLDLVAEAKRLLAIRDALRDAEAREAAQAFDDTAPAELEREVIRVPAAELASWFEPADTTGAP